MNSLYNINKKINNNNDFIDNNTNDDFIENIRYLFSNKLDKKINNNTNDDDFIENLSKFYHLKNR